MTNQHTSIALALLAAGLGLSACAQPKQITLLHVNDIHTHFLPEPADWVKEDPKPLIGGMVALKDAVDRERAAVEAAAGATLVLDAGDWLTGTPLSDMEVAGVKGGGFMQMMNAVGFDVSTIGNHDFDNGVASLPKLIALAQFPVVSANLKLNDALLAPSPWKIFERGGVKIGVVGLILEDLGQEISREMMDGIWVGHVAETANQAVTEIDPLTDLIVLLTHQGWKEDSLLATRVTGVDVIVGAHSHSRLKVPRVVNDVIVVQAGSYARDLGRLDLVVENDRVSSHSGRLISLFQRDVKNPDSALVALVNGFKQQIDAEFEVVIGEAGTGLGRSYFTESPLGDLMSDVVRDLAGVDVALLNSGGLRADLDTGPVTRLDIKQIMPFQNTVVTFSCTGVELLAMLKGNAEASLHETQGILQMSGIACRFRNGPSGVEILDPMVAGAPLDPQRVYTVATVDYVLGLADKYLGFTPVSHESRGGTLFQLVCDWVVAHPQLGTPQGGRFTLVP